MYNEIWPSTYTSFKPLVRCHVNDWKKCRRSRFCLTFVRQCYGRKFSKLRRLFIQNSIYFDLRGGGVKKGQKRSDVFYGRPPIPSVRQHVFFSFSLILIPTNFNPLLLCFKLPALSILVNPVQTQLLPMVFCYHNCSNVLWEKIVLVWGKKLRKKFANSRP